ncbi:MAG: homoaconitate hydratase [Candidatus Lokiarchaeota archaeon]|nr:homoaconitate hydratase [Candidatus Lokiarchaeota archaeon]
MNYRLNSKEARDLLYNYNSIPEIFPKSKPKTIKIWDETLRDGEQSPSVYLTKDEKIEIAKALDQVGVEIIAVGFPAVSESEFATVKALVGENFDNSTIVAIARPRESDIDACIKADLNEIVLFMPISELMMNILKTTPEEELILIDKMIHYAKDHGVRVNWVSEDASRAHPEHLINVYKTAIEAGVERIVLSDTVGVLSPPSMAYLADLVQSKALKGHENVGLGVHTHNDFGLAVANTVEAVFHGARFPHTCVNGYGERAGNAALEEVVMILERNNINTGIKLERLYELSKLVEKHFCLPLSPHKPIVGEFAFSHESGLHVNAILSHPLSYEPINPKIVGRNRKFYLGKLSGSGAITNALVEKLKLIDMNFPKEVVKDIVREVKSKQENAPKDQIRESFQEIKGNLGKITSGVSDKEFYEIVREVSGDKFEKYVQNGGNRKTKPNEKGK